MKDGDGRMEKDFECTSCSKESYNIVPIARILERIDALFARDDLEAVRRVLDYWDAEARRLNDERGLLEILNEKIGFYRRTNEKELALNAVKTAFELIDKLGLYGLESSGTIYLNGATTMKAFGEVDSAMSYYDKAREIYQNTLSDNDFRLAAFYNNVSSAYKEIGETQKCEESCLKAISILENIGGFLGEMAISHINLAHLYYDVDNFDDRIYSEMDKAWELLSDSRNAHDGNFAFVCSKCHPSFAFFGYFEYETRLKAIVKEIYEGT